jgi:NADH-quinone oxidoreductase subunit M
VAAAGVILAALYLLWAYQRVFHGEPGGENADMPDLRWQEGLVMLPLVGLIVFLGIYPKPFLERVEPSVDALVEHVEVHSGAAEDGTCFRQPEIARTGAETAEAEGSESEAQEEEGGE